MDKIDILWFIITGLIGGFVGLSELVNRYKSFARIFNNWNSWVYLLINFFAAALVYVIVKQYNISLGPLQNHTIGIALFCGLGAMAFLRSSFFNYKDSSGKSVEIGPAALLTVFLKAAETQFDQIVSNENVGNISTIVRGLPFTSASRDLPLIVLASMRVLSSDEQKTLSDDILKLINDNTTTTEVKNLALGLILIKYAGFDLLKTSIEKLNVIYADKAKIISEIQQIVI